jgi:sensor histidine kinase regulating citrate/malate metabolism
MTIIIGALLCLVSLDSIDKNSIIIIAVGFICLLIINIIILYIILDLKSKNHFLVESEKLKMQLEYNKQYVENAESEYELIQKLRHDTKNMYQVIGELLKEGDIKKAKEYVSKVIDMADEREIFIRTQNNAVNTIINSRLARAKTLQINVACFSVETFDGIDDFDLCRLLSNIIENAVSATAANKIVKKEIILRITQEYGQYIFLLKNSIDKSIIKTNPSLLTTKCEKENHGYGIKIIRDIAQKYQGICDFFEEDDMFCCFVVLNTD